MTPARLRALRPATPWYCPGSNPPPFTLPVLGWFADAPERDAYRVCTRWEDGWTDGSDEVMDDPPTYWTPLPRGPVQP
jgi:hypothetical protein